MDEAVARREEITPELLRILRERDATLAQARDNDGCWAHMAALYLLSQFRESLAFPLIVEFISGDPALVEDALGDVITYGLGRMLASTFDGDTALLKRMIEDPALDEFVREAALLALTAQVARGVLPRDEVMAYMKHLFAVLPREPNFVWSSLAHHATNLYPEEVREEIIQALADGLVDEFVVDEEVIEGVLAHPKDSALAKLAASREYAYITDAIAETDHWLCWQPLREPKPLVLPPPPTPLPPTQPVAVRTGPKIGRNDPCPCGSGTKYKKCCAHKDG
jgi:hypothetical protein